MKRVFKLVFLFVGVVIGAGFATGSEIVMYFRNNGYLSVLAASIIIGALSMVFCCFGKLNNRSKTIKNLIKIVVFISSAVTYCVMISGVSQLIFSQFSVPFFGALTALVTAFLMMYDMRIIKLLNLIIVPLIMVMMLVILSSTNAEFYTGFDIMAAFKYSGMNMLLGGYFMMNEADEMSVSQICATGGLVSVIMAALLTICYLISMQSPQSAMPIFEVARSNGLGALAAVVVYLAIFTTMIGSARAFADMLSPHYVAKGWLFALLFVLGLYFDGLDFAALVAFCYGKIGTIGMVICIVVCVALAAHLLAKMRDRLRKTGARQLRFF